MNQILVTEKLYVTPELRRKKKLYKLQLFFCIFLVCLLFSYYIYAEYDRFKSEEVSQEILLGINKEKEVDTTVKKVDDIIIVELEQDEDNNEVQIQEILNLDPSTEEYTTQAGVKYKVEAFVRIPRFEIEYPVISETSEELLKISVNKYWGPAPNTTGNYCIVGHNYKNKKMFGRLSEIENGDIIELEGVDKRILKYEVYNKYTVEPTDTSCTSQLTNGKKEITLITCTNYGTQRLVVKAREVK